MTRELTLRTSGMIFYLVLASILLASRAGAESLSCLFSQSGVTDVYQVVMAAVAASVAVFTSDAMGFLVSTIALFFWNRCTKLKLWWSIESGYSLDWEEHLGFNWRDHIVRRYNEKIGVEDSLDPKHGPPGAQWKAYGNDVFVSYFWELAPDRIGEWATRRYSAFQAHRSAITAIILGLVIGAACVGSMRLGCTATHWAILVVSAVVAAVFRKSADRSITEARQITALWLARAIDPQLNKVFTEIECELASKADVA